MLTSNINPFTSKPNADGGPAGPSPPSAPSASSSSSFSSGPTKAHTPHTPSATHVRRKTKSEDLHILAHAQTQFREHLEPLDSYSYSYPHQQQQQWQPQSHHHSHDHAARPRSSHPLSSSSSFPSSAPHAFGSRKPDIRTPAAHLAFRWWETDSLLDDGGAGDDDDDDDEESIRESIERDPPGESVVESIEVDDCAVSPGTCLAGTSRAEGEDEVEVDMSDAEEARIWDAAQREWNGYVRYKESWVRRAGLKRERDGVGERQGTAKRGRASG